MLNNTLSKIFAFEAMIFLSLAYCISFSRTDTTMKGISGFVAWYDLDDDGWLDMFQKSTSGMSGYDVCYKNLNGLGFKDSGSGLSYTNVYHAEFGYFFKGPSPDLLFGDWISWENNGATGVGKYAEYMSYSSAADYNNDGKLDFAVVGCIDEANDVWETVLYTNNYSGGLPVPFPFSKANVNFNNSPILFRADCGLVWGDIDNDYDMDLIVADCRDSAIKGVKIFINNNGVFTDETALRLPLDTAFVLIRALDLVDYNVDGYLDLRINDTIYTNNGNGYFLGRKIWCPDGTNLYAIGDLDNDGDPDFYSYRTSGGIIRNDIDSLVKEGTLNNPGNAVLGDYDNDGSLDLYMCSSYPNKGQLFRNTSPIKNTAPSVPSGLKTQVIGSTVYFSWNSSQDDHTPSKSLSYNLYVESIKDSCDIMRPLNKSKTHLRTPKMGNVQLDTGWKLINLKPGTYYWAVQAIDYAYISSAYAPKDSFSIGTALTIPDNKQKESRNIYFGSKKLPITKDFLSGGMLTISVFDIKGRKLQENTIDASASNTIRIPTVHLAEGIYLLKLASLSNVNYSAIYLK